MSLLQIYFILNDKTTGIQARSDEMFAETAFRYMQKAGIKEDDEPIFLYTCRKINLSAKTLNELGLKNMSRINVFLSKDVIGPWAPYPIAGPFLEISFRNGNKIIKIPTGSKNLFEEIAKNISFFGFGKGKHHFFLNMLELAEKDKTVADYKIDDKSIIDVIDCDPEHCKICCHNSITKINEEKKELENQLNREKDKNKKLLKEIDNLKGNLEISNKKMKELMKNKKEFLNNNQQSEYAITSINPGETVLAVNFVSMGNQDIGHYNLICKNNDLFVTLEERLYKDFPQFKNYNTIFQVKGKTIKRFKTMDENRIKNNDVISIFITED